MLFVCRQAKLELYFSYFVHFTEHLFIIIMELILDGNSEIVTHVRRNRCHLMILVS